jgi:prepilin-type N-terminal cleavage/methylation domain-containing protein
MKRTKGVTRRGFSLLEMAVVVIVLAIATGVLSQVFELAIRSMEQTAAAADRSARMDAALGQLRRDVWQSRDVQATAAGDLLHVLTPDGAVRWQIDPDGMLTRTVEPGGVGEAARSWIDTAEHWSFQSGDGSAVLVDASRDGGRMTFMSQIRLDRSEHP